jgi:hypothetical protein
MDDMQHAGEDNHPVKTLAGKCDNCGQDFFDHIVEDWQGNKFACPVQSEVEVITAYQRGFEDGLRWQIDSAMHSGGSADPERQGIDVPVIGSSQQRETNAK